jgi:hypothetical protein
MATDTRTRTAQRGPKLFQRISPFHFAKLVFMVAAFASLVFSVSLWASGNQMQAIFVGLWVPSIHSLGTLVLTGEHETFGGRR